MEMISNAIVQGSLEALLTEVKKDASPRAQNGTENRANRRRLKALERKRLKKQKHSVAERL